MNETELLIGLSAIFVLGIGAQWLAWWLRLPSILLLLSFGFVAGPLTGWLKPEELFGRELVLSAVSLAVGIVLFEGSLSLRVKELRGIGRPLGNLLTVGVFVTWLCCALGAWLLVGLDAATSLLLGALLVVTGPTVVGPLLRHIRPTGRVGPVAKWEGIVVDPIGAVLAVLVFEAEESIQSAKFLQATAGAAGGLLKTVLIGLPIGVGVGYLVGLLLRRHWIADHLHSPVSLTAVIAVFTVSNLLQKESGLLTVTVMGIVLANQRALTIRHILEFKENLVVVLISSLFILLTARLELPQFGALGFRGPLYVVFVIAVVRPLAVLASTAGSDLNWRERLFLSWLAPRGIVAAAVASVFALEMGASAEGLVPATFLVIVGTVVVYGLTAAPLANRLGLAVPNPQGVLFASAHPGARAIARSLHEAGFAVLLVDANAENIRAARMEGLPTCQANILSEQATEELDLGGIGRFLALTPNDEVNSLAALHFSEVFGRGGVYQLVPERSNERNEASAQSMHGRFLFGGDVTYRELDRRFAAGHLVKATPLTDEFDYDAFRAYYGESAVPLFIIDDSHKLTVCTADVRPAPRLGQTVIALAKPDSE